MVTIARRVVRRRRSPSALRRPRLSAARRAIQLESGLVLLGVVGIAGECAIAALTLAMIAAVAQGMLEY